ncbi:NAD(P)H-dependent glycerol-3-phosphate dehydrogenase [Haematomicrobium sanguinis]|uniref:NAD(P)H-dependent glycerol-3-phosphate dehydrogenase n=1 Tax=Haematomicrobium sanguinis TaxID=479106 RepID=UPI000A037FCC|nr:NAD(P)H-dependent glycerol-3-phosphate dehydrogenase [Haematomicrobium sanguinis]
MSDTHQEVTDNSTDAANSVRSREPLKKVAVLSAGSWGTTFAKVMADAAQTNKTGVSDTSTEFVLWARNPEVVEDINNRHRNSTYLGETALPGSMRATSDPRTALAGADVVVLAVPAQTLRAQLSELKDDFPPDAIVVSLMKGLELGTDLRMSEVIQEVLRVPARQVAVVSGPNLAMEIAREEPTASVVASTDEQTAALIAGASTTGYFRPYTNGDVVGVEIGGIVKNVIALAVGMCEGLGVGDNTKASVITRGLAETTRLAQALGGHAETMAGLAGLGDLVATCSSSLSRNHTAGKLLGEGLSLDEVAARMTQTAEGIKSGEAVHELAVKMGVEMPIAASVVKVLQGHLSATDLGPRLMGRQLKSEGEQ